MKKINSIQINKGNFVPPKLREEPHFPFSLPHYRLHLLCHFFKNLPRFIFTNLLQRLDFPDLVKIIQVHTDSTNTQLKRSKVKFKKVNLKDFLPTKYSKLYIKRLKGIRWSLVLITICKTKITIDKSTQQILEKS